ncbi:MAG: hypothetical protein OEY01_13415 [Desulfobulbaceae bacterium]|nr:hypothetical protein [Desulfobulbaceae bacterium]HIJ79728.1 hypothetical protein [Deltaproteobacteria bacterium]
MEHDIAKVLSYEIKKELADRYFGFRKLIEEDKEDLDRQIRQHSLTVEQKICLDLVRIYILLRDDDLVEEFLGLVGLTKEFFYDPYLLESPTIRARVFSGVKVKGFTMKGRFTNLILSSYETLVEHVERYRKNFGELLAERQTIAEEINLFYQKNDLGNIMTFLRSMDSSASVGGNPLENSRVGFGGTGDLEEKMRVAPPAPIEQSLPIIPGLPELKGIKKKLKGLAAAAYGRQAKSFVLDH